MQGIGRFVVLALITAASAHASEGPQPLPHPPSIPAPRDSPFTGVIRLHVDATDTAQRIYRVHETMPVQAGGPVTLLYPQWETGSHAPTASATALAGLTIRAQGRPLAWQRDTVNPFAFHVDVPSGAETLDLDFQYLSPFSSRQGLVTTTPDIVTVPWQSVVLYPAGWFVRNIPVDAHLTLPSGYAYVTALEDKKGEVGAFTTTSLETLVDSPVFAGRHVQRYDLGALGDAPVRLTTLASNTDDVKIDAGQLGLLRAMVEQTRKLLPVRHYAHYDFMLALSNDLPGPGGIEQAQSSSDVLPPDFFRHNENYLVDRDLLAHEFVHSWNGRYRQPADLWSATFNEPMRGSLLWVYEGQTEFWGRVLAARSGLRTKQETLDALAVGAASVLSQSGREWKTLQDSTNDPLIAAGHPLSWRDWQRREDYYGEGVLLWLAVDAEIREKTHDSKSLDDFARDFFGSGKQADMTTSTYTFNDVCAALQQIAPDDWATFLRSRLDTHDPAHVIDGLEHEGYRLVFDGTPSEYSKQSEIDAGARDFSSAIGLTIGKGGVVKTVSWNGPAFRAGLAPGSRIDAVYGKAFSPELLDDALKVLHPAPLRLAVTTDGTTSTVNVKPTGPLRYPHLQRIDGSRDILNTLLQPLP
ncbi:putative metalloprotease with PDZ domain [Luteibacter sp. HA06]